MLLRGRTISTEVRGIWPKWAGEELHETRLKLSLIWTQWTPEAKEAPRGEKFAKHHPEPARLRLPSGCRPREALNPPSGNRRQRGTASLEGECSLGIRPKAERSEGEGVAREAIPRW